MIPIHSRRGNSARPGLCLCPCPFDKSVMGVKLSNLEKAGEGTEQRKKKKKTNGPNLASFSVFGRMFNLPTIIS